MRVDEDVRLCGGCRGRGETYAMNDPQTCSVCQGNGFVFSQLIVPDCDEPFQPATD